MEDKRRRVVFYCNICQKKVNKFYVSIPRKVMWDGGCCGSL